MNSTPSSSPPFAAFIGIDRSDRHIDVTTLSPARESLGHSRVSSDPLHLEEWVRTQRSAFPDGSLAICIEQPCANLVAFFSRFDFVTLFLLNPATLKRWREAFQTSRAKDDRGDSDNLAQLLYERHARLTPWRAQDPHTRQLRQLCQGRRSLVDQRTAIGNQLIANLKDYFPQALELVGRDIHSELACRFLSKWPTLEALKRARPATIRAFYYAHHSRRPKTIDKRLETIKNAVPLSEDPALIDPLVMMTLALVSQLDALRRHIARFEADIERLYAEHPDQDLFRDLPGAGHILGSRLLVAFGSDRDRFPDASAVQRFFGLAPITIQSGRTRLVFRRRAHPHFEHQTFIEWVGQTVIKSVWARACYDDLRERGQRHFSAIRTLAYKWIRILYRSWKDRKPYDEQRYIEALRKAGSPLTARIDDLLQPSE